MNFHPTFPYNVEIPLSLILDTPVIYEFWYLIQNMDADLPSTNGHNIAHGILTFIKTWTTRRVPRSATPHAPLCKHSSSKILSQFSGT